ncbi:uncharacterized protein DS421_11g329730 [Arachis hypogaea]|nr:uncharacterized protein DS421_11g329730 [Arachis hypogaea]
MAKNDAANAIAMLIIGIFIICYINGESYYIFSKGACTPSYYIASNKLGDCITQCQKHHPSNPVKRKKCLQDCCVIECRMRHPYDTEKLRECYKVLYVMYVK